MAEARDLRTWLGAMSLASLTVLSGPALAQSSDTLTVLANVGGECSVTGATLDFGSYTGDRKDVDVPISFTCNAPTNVAISMNGGSTGDPSGRSMFNGDFSGEMRYQLFRDAGRTQLWGVFPQDHANFTSASNGTPTVFGRIPAGQNPPAESYKDEVVITLTTN